MDRFDILFYTTIIITCLGLGFLGISYSPNAAPYPFRVGMFLVGIGIFSMLLTIAAKLFTVIVDRMYLGTETK